jgi:hypothetical protein
MIMLVQVIIIIINHSDNVRDWVGNTPGPDWFEDEQHAS